MTNKRHVMKNYQAKPLPVRCKRCGDVKRAVAPFYVSIAPSLDICANCINEILKGAASRKDTTLPVHLG